MSAIGHAGDVEPIPATYGRPPNHQVTCALMDDHSSSIIATEPDTANDAQSSWNARYGTAHRLQRVRDFPAGVTSPKKVRIYLRRDHFIVQWWDPASKRTLSVRVAGDLIDALAEARKIEARLSNFKTAGRAVRKLGHDELVDCFLANLHRRADACELAAATVARYGTALNHYRAFCERPEIRKAYPTAASVNHAFRLDFAAQLATSNHDRKGGDIASAAQSGPVFDAVRAMFNWAANPDRGHLLPEGFRNPFDRAERPLRRAAHDPFGEPDITVPMAVDFIGDCDTFQLPLFATLILFGLRASEPIYLFHEQLEGHWLKVKCLPEIDYLTKGQRDKRFPLVPALDNLLRTAAGGKGLLFARRTVVQKIREMPLFGASLTQLAEEFHCRCRAAERPSAVARQRIREELLHDARGLNYDYIEHEFQSIARRLQWPPAATLKDFRHLFSTCLENSGVPEFYRRYLMGQSPGKTPIVTYTHLNELQVQFAKALQSGLAPLVAAVADRALQLKCLNYTNTNNREGEPV